MGLSTQEQVRYWGLATLVLFAFIWLLGDTLLPFLMGAAIAYLLDPVADWLENHGFSRLVATALITFLVVVVFAIILLLMAPVIRDQLSGLVGAVPGYIANLQAFLAERGLLEEGSVLREGLVSMQDRLQSAGLALVEGVLSSSLVLLDAVLILVVAPVVSFYMLLDWDRMIARVDDLIPREHLTTVRRLAGEIDLVLAGFVRGQLSVCVVLGLFYALALVGVGLQFGVFVGIFAGLISFIPFVGSITGGVLSIGLAIVQFWSDPIWILVVAAIFVFGQVVEGNVLTPYMVGGSVGLHPVMLMFALTAFGAIFGFPGLLIAVPAAASIGVLAR
ncbi:MAG: AI-2E family transporter, partial [Pseudomonadota bacterium]